MIKQVLAKCLEKLQKSGLATIESFSLNVMPVLIFMVVTDHSK